MATTHSSPAYFVPREHGATAMMLTPFIAAAILLRQFYWPELVALVAVTCAFLIKDPLVVIARQRFVWKQQHPETAAAKQSVSVQFSLAAICGVALMLVRDWRPFVALFAAGAGFTVLAVTMTVRNRQRSEWFQVAGAVALSATSLIASLSAMGRIADWCWMLWALCALQATTGIFVVHARLDARVAAKSGRPTRSNSRRVAFFFQMLLVAAGALAVAMGRIWIAAALFIAAIWYLAELVRQKNPESLQMPLKRVGLEALGLSSAYALLLVAGLWRA